MAYMDGARRGARGNVAVVRCGYYPEDPRVFKEVAALQQAGYSVTVLCLRMPGEPLRETVGGVSILRRNREHVRSGYLARLRMYLGMLAWSAWQLRRLHGRTPLAAVQVNTLPDFLVFCAYPVRRLGVPVVIDLHEVLPELFASEYAGPFKGLFTSWLLTLERLSIRFADAALCPGPSYRDVYAARGFEPSLFTLVFNAPADGLFESVSGSTDRDKLVAHGSIIERYGFDVIVGAMPAILRSHPNARLLVIGDGDHRPVVERKAQELELGDKVEFVGRIPLETMATELADAAIGLVATRRSPFTDRILPNKIYELAALHVPIVSSDITAVLATFGEDGIAFFEGDDEEALARAVVGLLDDPERAREQAASAFATYQHVRWSANKHDYLGVFDRIIEPHAL